MSTSTTIYKSHQQIDVQITNADKSAISYCVQFGQVSSRTGAGTVEDIEHTPIPFYVQEWNRCKWNTLLIGPDVGSSRHAVVLKAGESQHYPFRLNDHGQMRLVLDYWRGENDRACEYPKGKKATRSKIFVVD